jgi:hypothetical protein
MSSSGYCYANIPTLYGGVKFRSRLEARWAAFADLAGWEWEYEPVDLKGWIPDFLFKLPCGHSECGMTTATKCPHCGMPVTEIVVEPVVHKNWLSEDPPTYTVLSPVGARCQGCGAIHKHWRRDPDFRHELYAEVKPYRSLEEFDGHAVTQIDSWEVPSPACFGYHPSVTRWEMAHGEGGGIYSVLDWYDGDAEAAWIEAGNLTRWRGGF